MDRPGAVGLEHWKQQDLLEARGDARHDIVTNDTNSATNKQQDLLEEWGDARHDIVTTDTNWATGDWSDLVF